MENNNRWLVFGAFANIYIIWGITFLAISFGIEGFPPFILSGFRFLSAGLLIFGYLLAKGEKANSIINWKKNAITGIFILTGGTGLVGWGEQYVSASEAAIAIATGPFWFIAIDRKNWKSYFRDKFIPIGLLIGFTGLVIFLNGSVNESQHSITSNLQIMAFLVLALSSILWVLGSLHSKTNPPSHSKYMNIAQQLITAAIASFVVALIRGEWLVFSFSKVPTTAWLGLVFLVVFGSMVAYMSYIWLLSVQPAALVSTHTYINPIVTVMVGWIISNQVININQFYGLLIILLGVLLTNASKYFKLSNRSKVKIRRIKVKLIQIGSPYKPLIQLK